MLIYFASPLFSEMELEFNKNLVEKIRNKYSEVEVYLPQENFSINDKNSYADSVQIALGDNEKLLESDLVIAVLDGQTVDSGVAAEVGLAFGKRIPVLGLYTDSRQNGSDNKEKLEALKNIAESQFSYINLYLIGLIKLNGSVVNNSELLLETILEYL